MIAAIRLVLWLLLAALTAIAWPPARSRPFGKLDPSGVTVLAGNVYDTDSAGRPLSLDVYLPPPLSPPDVLAARRPAMIAIHGGSWIGGSRSDFESAPRDTLFRLARAGIVVVAVDYPLARPGAPTFPAVVTHLRAAVRWIRAHAVDANIDTDRIAAIGQSSGAHLAALLAAPDPAADALDVALGYSSRVQALVGFYGVYDLPALLEDRHLSNEPLFTLLGSRPKTAASIPTTASPQELVTAQFPPTLLIHGTADLWIPPSQSLRMAKTLTRATVLNKLILVPGAPHGFEATVNAPTRRDLLPEIFDFLHAVWNTAPGGISKNSPVMMRGDR